jgi:hypothetical protein
MIFFLLGVMIVLYFVIARSIARGDASYGAMFFFCFLFYVAFTFLAEMGAR